MTVTAEQVSRVNREAPMTDVHVHPSLKAYMFRRNLWRHYRSGGAFNPFSSRSDFKMLEKGEVGVIWSALNVPEHELFDRCFLLKAAAYVASPVGRKLTTGSYFQRVIEQMDAMEGEINRDPDRTGLARSPAEVKNLTGQRKIAVVHTVEGAHVLEGNLDHLDELHRRGVAMLTLTHFYPNGVADPVDAIPQDMFIRKLCNNLGPPLPTPPGLTPFGKAVIHRMKDLGMVVDIAHCTPGARAEVFAEAGTDMPIVASHVGVDALHENVYNLKDFEIRHIAETRGAIGVIFMNYWLGHLRPDPADLDVGIWNIWLTAKHIHDVTETYIEDMKADGREAEVADLSPWDCVMLGTDFDGFTDPPDDAKDSSRMPQITAAFLRMGVSEDDVKKVIGGNAQRVLELGWR